MLDKARPPPARASMLYLIDVNVTAADRANSIGGGFPHNILGGNHLKSFDNSPYL